MLALLLLVQAVASGIPDSGAATAAGMAVDGKGSPTAEIPRVEAAERP